jgi:predicted enzyme related to lactoylglutathione lyase
MRFYMLQIAVDHWAEALAWYRDVLGLKVSLLDEPNRFALLDAGPSRLALKQRAESLPPPASDDLLVFEVEDLDATLSQLVTQGCRILDPPKRSAEGYSMAAIAGPENRRICLFMWDLKKR